MHWKVKDLGPIEKEIDALLTKYMDDHPEIDLPVACAALANILTALLDAAPTAWKLTVRAALHSGTKVIIQEAKDS